MRNLTTLFVSCLLIAVFFGCNEAKHSTPLPVVENAHDTIILKSQNGYRDAPSGSYCDLYNVMQFMHSTVTDSSFALFHFDSVVSATNYYLDMKLAGLKPNNGKFDIKVNCKLNLASPHDSICMFVAQYNNGTKMQLDTITVKKDDKSFTLHVPNATASYYYIVLWGLNRAPASTVAFQDIMVTSPK